MAINPLQLPTFNPQGMDLTPMFRELGETIEKSRKERQAQQAIDFALGVPSKESPGLLSQLGSMIFGGGQPAPGGQQGQTPSLASLGASIFGGGQQAAAPPPQMSLASLGTPPAAAAPAPRPQSAAAMPPDNIKQIIDANVPEARREYFYRLTGKESSFDPNAVSPTGAAGLVQFTRGTGGDYGLVGDGYDRRKDPTENIKAGVRFTDDNERKLTAALGRQPTDSELALAHQQGAQGAIALLTGQGNVSPRNLQVNGIDPTMPRDQIVQRVNGFYGMPGAPQPAPNAGPAGVQVASATPMAFAAPQATAPTVPPSVTQVAAGDTQRPNAAPQGQQVAQAAPPQSAFKTPTADQLFNPAEMAQLQQLRQSNPSLALQVIQERKAQWAKQNEPKMTNVAPGGVVFDERTRQPVYRAPDKDDRTTNERDYLAYEKEERAAGRVPLSRHQREIELKRAGALAITNDLKGEGAEAQAVGKAAGERAGELMKSASMASRNLATYARAGAMLDRVAQGKLEPGKMTLSAWGKSFGLDDKTLEGIGLNPKSVGDGQALNAMLNELVLGKIGPGGMPANNFSNTDREFLTQTLMQISNDPRANKIILESMRRVAHRDIEKGKAYMDYRRDAANKGKSFDDFEMSWADKVANEDLMGDLRKQAETLGVQAGPSAAPAAAPPQRPAARMPATPKAGEQMDGFRFKGGNPADPSAWERM